MSVAACRTEPVAAVGVAVCWSLPVVGLYAVACQLVRVVAVDVAVEVAVSAADLVASWLAAVSAAVAVRRTGSFAVVGAVVVSVVAAAGSWFAPPYVAAVGVSLAVAVECGVRALVVVPVSVA